jgi:hypothetical protein
MVGAQNEHMLVVATGEQACPQHGAGLHVVGGFDDVIDGRVDGGLVGDVGVDLEHGRLAQPTDGLAVLLVDAHAQHGVLGDHRKGPHEIIGPQVTLELNDPADVRDGGVGVHVVQQPETPFHGGEGKGARRRRHRLGG